jgi:hypothetical protein
LRFSWGGGTEQTWTGKISVNKGKFSSAAPLGLSPQATAEAILVGGELVINHWSPSNYGGSDVALEGTSETQVHIALSSVEHPESGFERTMTFDEIVSNTVGGEIDSLGNRCSVTRVPGDLIGIAFERDHLVFRPGEKFEFSFRPNLAGLTTRSANGRVRLMPAQATGRTGIRSLFSKTVSFQIDESGSADAQRVSLAVPDQEGIYNLEIELESNWYQASLSPKKNPIRRSIQLIVLGDQPIPAEKTSWKKVATVDPVKVQKSFPSWSQFSRIAGLSKDTLGNEFRSPVEVDRQPMMELAPGGWQAIPLSVDRLNKPHVVEFEYVSDGEMALGVSLLQPDTSGQVPLYGFDSGVFIPKSLVANATNGPKIRRHRLTIWPKAKTPYLLIANRHASANATVGKVTVFAGPDRLEPSETAAAGARGDSRKLMAFYEAPLFPENFGAREKVDPSVGKPLDDWRMFYEGADRFIEYLKANAYRGAFITVACDGSSIYPSRHLSPSPKHDNGTFFSTGQDPIRKDVLEMLFRMFEREGLTLVPALALSGPIPEIEQARPLDGSDADFDMVDLNQMKRPSTGNPMLPIYNPLNRKVQRSVTRIVEELAQRYKSYSSFDGIAIVCRPDTYTLLPGRQWGYDSVTIQQFFQSQTDNTPFPVQWDAIQNVLLGSHRKQWIDWRANQMTKWYEQMATALKRAVPGGKLYLAPIDLYRNEEIASALSPSLHASSDFEQTMLHLGFTSAIVGSQPTETGNGIVFLNPHRVAPDQALSSQRVDLAVENSKQAQQFFSRVSYAGDLFTHRVSWAHFAQLQTHSPFGKQEEPLMRLQQMAPSEQFNRQRFVQSIKQRDARMLVDGGWMLTMGQEESLVDIMNVFSQLPDARFADVDSSRHSKPRPVAVRQLQHGSESFFYVANASPWPMNITLMVTSNATDGLPKIESLSRHGLQINPASDSSTSTAGPESPFEINVQVPAFGLVGGRSVSRFSISDFDFELPDHADKNLRRHVYSLQSKLVKSGNASPIPVIENSSFEVNDRPTLSGWDSGQQSTGKVRLDTDQGRSESPAPFGRVSLLMANDDPAPVWVRSNTFESSETGRLSIAVWLKTADPSQQPPLRLAVEGETNGSSYYRFGSIGSLSPDPNANQIESRWKRFAVHFDDLPVNGLSNVRIGFDLMGPGQVNIDNVQVFDRWFDENDAKAITQLLASTGPLLSSPATFDSCRRLLESYWPSFLDEYIADDESVTNAGSTQPAGGQEEVKRGSPDATPNAISRALTDGARESTVDENGKRKVPMFRRFRSLVPQRKPTLR